jgi:WD40 repeat protein
MDTLLQVVEGEPARPSALERRMDRDVETICLKCLEKEPSRRYGSAEALADDLERWLGHEPIRARRSGLGERALKWARRRPAVAALLALLLVVTAAAFGVVTWKWQEAQAAEQRAEDKADDEKKARERAEQAQREAEEARQAAEKAKREAQQALEQAERQLYFNRVALAYSEWQAGNVARTQELLDLCPESHRHWEWHFIRRLCHRDLFTLKHDGRVNTVAYSPDGKQVATGSAEKRVCIWDAATGKLVHEFATNQSVRSVAYSPDGKYLAGASPRTVRVWDTETGKLSQTLKDLSPVVLCVAFSPDGKQLAWSGGTIETSLVKVHDTESGKELVALPEQPGEVRSVAFAPDGKRLAVCSGQRAAIYDLATQQPVHVLNEGRGSWYSAVAWASDGKFIAVVGITSDRAVHLYDAASGKKLAQWRGHNGSIHGLRFSPDGRCVATASGDQTIKVWDVATGQVIQTLRGHAGPVNGVAFRPDGRHLASASEDGTAMLWDLDRPEIALTRVRFGGGGDGAYPFSPSGQHVVAFQGRRVRVWEAATGKDVLRKDMNARPSQAVFSPDGKQLVVADEEGNVAFWDAATSEERGRLKAHEGLVTGLAFHPGGQQLVTGGQDQTVKIWDVAGARELRTLRGHVHRIASAVYSPDGRRLISAAYQLNKGGELKLWDAETGQELWRHKAQGSSHITAAFSPDGKRLAVGHGQGVIQLWDAGQKWDDRASPLLILRGHTTGGAAALAFSPDSRRLTSVGGDQTLRIWDAQSGEPILTVRDLGGSARWAFFSPDGRFLAVAKAGPNEIQVWDGTPWAPPAEK